MIVAFGQRGEVFDKDVGNALIIELGHFIEFAHSIILGIWILAISHGIKKIGFTVFSWIKDRHSEKFTGDFEFIDPGIDLVDGDFVFIGQSWGAIAANHHLEQDLGSFVDADVAGFVVGFVDVGDSERTDFILLNRTLVDDSSVLDEILPGTTSTIDVDAMLFGIFHDIFICDVGLFALDQ